jgi:hypothetical protein
MGDDFDASKIKVFTGEIPALTSPPQAYGLKFFHPESKKLCNNDIAFLILDRQIDVIPATIRKKPYVNSSETFKISGYGLNNLNMLGVSGNPYGVRLSMSNVPLSNHSLNEFWLQGGSLDQKEMRGGACNGDSGGPAFSESTKSVVGILSRGGDCNTNAVKMYSFIGSHLDLLNLAVNESGSSIFEEGSDVVLPNLNPQDSTKTKMTCSHSEGHETSIVELFFVFIVVVSFFRKFGLI